ncbi:MAG TPA: hypothetical protein VFJ57_00665 [Solirubrobacterales bacterium]|nr:hypothetical protein [Solirubrobacterales bacterium]
MAVNAVAAQSAFAVVGITAATCKKTGGPADFLKAHCKTADFSPGNGEFSHKFFNEKERTEVYVTDAGNGANTTTTTPFKLHGVSAGIEFEIASSSAEGSSSVEGTGSMENMKAEAGEPTASGTGTVEYLGVVVVKPAGKGCEVAGKKVVTNVKATTAGAGMELKVEPSEGSAFTSFKVEGCSVSALNGEYEVKGSIKCGMDGATFTCTKAATTAQKSLTFRGQAAGIDGSITFTSRKEKTEPYTPLGQTTVDE